MDNTVLLWLVSFGISAISVAIFLYFSFFHRKKIDRLTEQLRDCTPRLVDSFLQREAQSMRNRLRSAIGTETNIPTLEQLRVQWLEAESMALVDRGKRHSDYAVLLRSLQPLLRLVTRPPAATKWNNKAATDNLQKARDVIAAQRQTISSFREQNSTTVPSENAESAVRDFSHVLDGVDKNNATLVETITRLERELAAVQRRFDETNAKLGESQAQLKRVGQTVDIHVSTTVDADAAKKEATRELIAEIELAYKRSMTEMDRMRTMNREQRALILQLENELLQLRGNAQQYEASSTLLEKMKLQLRDYETCTVILEMETESLRERIEALNHSLIADEPDAPNTPAVLKPDEKINSSLALLRDLTTLNSADQIATRLIQYLRDIDLTATLFVRCGNEDAWASSEGMLDANDSRLLKSIVPTPGKPRVDVEEGPLLIYSHCGILLHAKHRAMAQFERLCESLQMVMTVLNHWLGLSGAPKRMQGGLHNQISGVLTQHNYVTSEHARINQQLRSELDSVFASVTLTPVQRQMLDTLLEDFDAQIDIIMKAGKLIHVELKTVLADFDASR